MLLRWPKCNVRHAPALTDGEERKKEGHLRGREVAIRVIHLAGGVMEVEEVVEGVEMAEKKGRAVARREGFLGVGIVERRVRRKRW